MAEEGLLATPEDENCAELTIIGVEQGRGQKVVRLCSGFVPVTKRTQRVAVAYPRMFHAL